MAISFCPVCGKDLETFMEKSYRTKGFLFERQTKIIRQPNLDEGEGVFQENVD